VPLQSNGFQVFLTRAFELTDPLAIARARAGVASTMAISAQAASGQSSSLPLATEPLPEPATGVMLLLGAIGLSRIRRRRFAYHGTATGTTAA
jgi:hypothetical protein